jgi:hypothetical protein
MSFSIEEIIGKYVELRDRKAALAKQHDEEMKQFTEPMQNIENFLMHQMNTLGVSQLKGETGTAYKAVSTSVQLKEPVEFKSFVFAPAADAVINHLRSLGIDIPPVESTKIFEIICDLPRWDVVDFRACKKGIQEYQEHSSQAVPGVMVNSIATVNIRRS